MVHIFDLYIMMDKLGKYFGTNLARSGAFGYVFTYIGVRMA